MTVLSSHVRPLVAIACGGTGGHLFPGLAIADELLARGCEVMLMVSRKEVDQQAIQTVHGMQVVTVPAIGLQRGHFWRFLRGLWKSYDACRTLFGVRAPEAVLAMGGFTSVAPVLAGRNFGAVTFLHESNTIPGRANRWLAHFVDQAFVGFPSAAARLRHQNVLTTGTPVRSQFQPAEPAGCRLALGLDARRSVLLVMGGSQGASGINELMLAALPWLMETKPELQYLHLTGPADHPKVQTAYRERGCRAVVRPFLSEMELALGAASGAVSRAGASSLAETAAMRVPSILIPYPFAADNHQHHNARAIADAGGALVLEQAGATGEKLAEMIIRLLDPAENTRMAEELGRWHSPEAARIIAEKILFLIRARGLWPEDKSRPQAAGGASATDLGRQKASALA